MGAALFGGTNYPQIYLTSRGEVRETPSAFGHGGPELRVAVIPELDELRVVLDRSFPITPLQIPPGRVKY